MRKCLNRVDFLSIRKQSNSRIFCICYYLLAVVAVLIILFSFSFFVFPYEQQQFENNYLLKKVKDQFDLSNKKAISNWQNNPSIDIYKKFNFFLTFQTVDQKLSHMVQLEQLNSDPLYEKENKTALFYYNFNHSFYEQQFGKLDLQYLDLNYEMMPQQCIALSYVEPNNRILLPVQKQGYCHIKHMNDLQQNIFNFFQVRRIHRQKGLQYENLILVRYRLNCKYNIELREYEMLEKIEQTQEIIKSEKCGKDKNRLINRRCEGQMNGEWCEQYYILNMAVFFVEIEKQNHFLNHNLTINQDQQYLLYQRLNMLNSSQSNNLSIYIRDIKDPYFLAINISQSLYNPQNILSTTFPKYIIISFLGGWSLIGFLSFIYLLLKLQ